MSGRSTIRIDLSAGAPVYRQIVDALRPLLVSGRLRPGDTLPPVRQLAIDLGIHFNTVAQAYRILAEEGWLDLKRRRGAVVLERPPATRPEPARAAQLTRRLRELVAAMQAGGLSRAAIARELKALAEGLER
jgi:GntR family transcriptional regulator